MILVCLFLALVVVSATPDAKFDWNDRDAVKFFLMEIESGRHHLLGTNKSYDDLLYYLFKEEKANEARQRKYFYPPKQRDLKLGMDRHGAEFQVCAEVTGNNWKDSRRIRCPRISPIAPACAVTLAISLAYPDQPFFSAGCSLAMECSPDCTLTETKKSWFDGSNDIIIQNCCCTNEMCNADFHGILNKGGNFTESFLMAKFKKDLANEATVFQN